MCCSIIFGTKLVSLALMPHRKRCNPRAQICQSQFGLARDVQLKAPHRRQNKNAFRLATLSKRQMFCRCTEFLGALLSTMLLIFAIWIFSVGSNTHRHVESNTQLIVCSSQNVRLLLLMAHGGETPLVSQLFESLLEDPSAVTRQRSFLRLSPEGGEAGVRNSCS